MLLKTWFLLLYLFSNAKSGLINFIQMISQHQTVARDFQLQLEILLEFQNTIMYFNASWICLRFALDLLEKNMYSFPVNVLLVSKTSSRRLQRNKFPSYKTSYKMSWRRLCKTSWSRVENVLEDKKLLPWNRLEDVFKASWKPSNVYWNYY